MARSDIAAPTAALLRDGFCRIDGLLPRSTLAALEADLASDFAATPMGQGHFYGFRTKRFGSLPRRSSHAEALILHPTIVALADAILGTACERIQLNVAQAIEIHPGEIEQMPHRDHDMWPGTKHGHQFLLNVMWPLTAFTTTNGGTRFYPGSHRALDRTHHDCGEPSVPHCAPGSAICFLGSTLHAAGANRSGTVRRGVVIGYSLGWLKPYENLWLAYPPEVARRFSPELAALAGYRQHRPNLGNYEGQCPSILLGEGAPAHVGAIDALRPDQAEAVAAFAAERRDNR
jgi:ectoine hydroxylase-related dioxygenase (phytanoyl-CoA dioxygenase family)